MDADGDRRPAGAASGRRIVRSLLLVTVGVIVAAVCVRLGIWQLDRLDQRRAFNAAVIAGRDAAPVPVAGAVPPGAPAPDRSFPEPPSYRRVVATGDYESDGEVTLYGRTQNGRNGDHLLTPLRLPDGRAVIVDRGWVPDGVDPADVRPPSGEVSVTGILVPPDATDGTPVHGGATLARIDLGALAGTVDEPLLPYSIVLQSQAPAQAGSLPEPVAFPALSEGPHLSYAIQWFAFAAIALIGCVVLLWRDRVRD